jgi:LacI family transcriptional regulator
MQNRRIGIMLELIWPYRRHLDVFAGTQRFAKEAGDWECAIDEFYRHDGASQSPLRGLDGVIARATPEMADRARRARIPLVNVWLNSPVYDRLPGVVPNFAEIGRTAGEHLFDRGFRKFACLSTRRERGHQLMTGAFHSTIRKHGCKCTCVGVRRFYYRTPESWHLFQQEIDAWIKSWVPPVALFVAFNDVTTRYIVHACRRHGLSVPEDVAIIGATNEPMISEMPPPSLSSVEVNYEQIGYRAAQMLDQLLRRKKLPEKHLLVPPSGVIARDSTDFFAVQDEIVARALRFIEGNISKPFQVGDVAAAARASRRTLERRFQKNCGRSIAQEIRLLRLQKAKRLLAETDMLVKQISRETGFNDPIRLHELFVREEGMTPTSYRRKMAGGA